MKKPRIQQIDISSPVGLVLADRRLFNYLLLHALSLPEKSEGYHVSFDELAGIFSSKAPDPFRLSHGIERLLKVTIKVSGSGPDEDIDITNLLSSARIDVKNAVLSYAFSPVARMIYDDPKLLEYCLIEAHFEYKYSQLLYKVLAEQAFSVNKNTSFSIEMVQLRECISIEKDKLKNFNDFDRFVLTPAINEINLYASFIVTVEPVKQGRRVAALNFSFQRKRSIKNKKNPIGVIPVHRPKITIKNPEEERAYAYLLNATTKERKQYFNIALKEAKKKKLSLGLDALDTPDVWFELCKKALLSHN